MIERILTFIAWVFAIAAVLGCLFIIYVIGLAVFAASRGYAHDHWINYGGYKSPTGEHCCGDNDCKVLETSEVTITPAGYALSNGEVVPYSEAQQSEDEHYWRCKRYDGSRRCFFAPGQGS